MNLKLTKKEVMNNFRNVISVGYCDLCFLERRLNKIGYTCGVYGWNANVYRLNEDTCLVTGYRPFGNCKTSANVEEINEKAKDIAGNYTMSFEEEQKEIEKLVKEILKGVN